MLSMADESIGQDIAVAGRALPVGTVLSGDQFTITDQLGAGGFGITYRAKDNVLGRTVVIKECFPGEFCVRDGKNVVSRDKAFDKPVQSIVRMFIREARSLAKLRHPNIVGVHRAFEENETAYMALDLIDGRDLFDVLQSDAPALAPARVKTILLQLLHAIAEVHKLDLLHRDISPDNIILEKNGTPVLIDFGAARGDASRHTRAVSTLLVVKDGYSPQEFYTAGSDQFPSSDLYALAATFYHVISGAAPTDSQARMIELVGNRPDPVVPLAGRIPGYDEEFLQAIDDAMNIHPQDRPQSASKWISLISNGEAVKSDATSQGVELGGEISLELEQSLSRLVEETNDEVRRTSRLVTMPEKEKIIEPEAAKTPDWVVEFNQETREPKVEPEIDLDDDWFDTFDADADLPDNEPVEAVQTETSRPQSETNWIDRAMEKQERLELEREAALAMLEAQDGNKRRSSRPSVPRDLHEELPDGSGTVELAPKEDIKSIRFLVVLLICFLFAAYLQLT